MYCRVEPRCLPALPKKKKHIFLPGSAKSAALGQVKRVGRGLCLAPASRSVRSSGGSQLNPCSGSRAGSTGG